MLLVHREFSCTGHLDHQLEPNRPNQLEPIHSNHEPWDTSVRGHTRRIARCLWDYRHHTGLKRCGPLRQGARTHDDMASVLLDRTRLAKDIHV